MANISTSNSNQIYKYTAQIEMMFEGDDEPTIIEFIRFKSIIIDRNYDGLNFPLIYCNLNLPLEMVVKLNEGKETETVVFTLQKYIDNSDMPIPIDVIREECIFKLPSDAGKNNERVYNEDKTDDLGINITVGLISLKHINASKKVSRGNVKQGTMSALINNLFREHQLCIEPLQYNTKLENFALPKVNTVAKLLEALNRYRVYYDTPYRFFIDFDMTYFLSSSGKGTKVKGEESNKVKFVLQDQYEERNMEGMDYELDGGMYVIDASGSYADVSKDSDSSASFSSIEAVTSQGKVQKLDTGTRPAKSPVVEKTNEIRLPNNNTKLLDNMIAQAAANSSLLTLSKNKIDTSIITPNKEYYVDADLVYKEGDKSGIYILSRKREIYQPEGEGFACAIILNMKKVSDA